VILIDTNLLLYAHVRSVAEHERANRWLARQLVGGARIGLPWHSLLGFVRLVSNPRAFLDPMPVTKAWQQVLDWLRLETVWIPLPTDRHAKILTDLFSTSGLTTRAVMDAHLAALAIEHGLTLCSADTGFARYKTLRWMNPLVDD
jgi:toxin-antitoxin system PIN domain toxin